MVTDRVVISENTARLMKHWRLAMQRTQQMRHWDDTFEVRRVVRDSAWAAGTARETETVITSGRGKLYAMGRGNVETNGSIVAMAPYRFQLDRSANVHAGDILIVNGTRQFIVDVEPANGDIDDRMKDVWIRERTSGGTR